MKTLLTAFLLAVCAAVFAQGTATTGGIGAAPGAPMSGAPIGNAGTYGTTPNNTGVGAPTGASSTFGTPLPGTGAVNTPSRNTFDKVLESGSSTGSSAASGATRATTCRPGAIAC